MTRPNSEIMISLRARDDVDAEADTTHENFHLVGDLRDDTFQTACRQAFDDLLQRAVNTRREALL